MKVLVLLFLMVSCAQLGQLEGPYRSPSSLTESPFIYGDVDAEKSRVKPMPLGHLESAVQFLYFVEVKDENGEYVDRDPHEFKVFLNKKSIPFDLQRHLRGRYYIVVHSSLSSPLKGMLSFEVADIKLNEKFKLIHQKIPSRKTSKMKLLSVKEGGAVIELSLKDENGKPIEGNEPPEFILDGMAHIESIDPQGKGIWKLTLSFPEDNQLFYISVRSQGIYFKNLFRFQYVSN